MKGAPGRHSRVPLVAFAGPADAAVTARGSVEQVYLTGAKPGARLTLLDRYGRRVAVMRAGRLGAALIRHVKPGRGYRGAG